MRAPESSRLLCHEPWCSLASPIMQLAPGEEPQDEAEEGEEEAHEEDPEEDVAVALVAD